MDERNLDLIFLAVSLSLSLPVHGVDLFLWEKGRGMRKRQGGREEEKDGNEERG